jgi:hypothetical protein
MRKDWWFMLGVDNSLNILRFAMFFVFGISTSSSFLEFALRFDELDELFSYLVVFLFVLVILSILGSNTSAPVWKDLSIKKFTIEEKLNKNFFGNGAKIW